MSEAAGAESAAPAPEGALRGSLPWRDTAARFGRVSRGLHGLTALCLVGTVLLAWTWGLPGRGPLQNAMVEWHRTTGLAILALTLGRIAWRAGNLRPRWPLPGWMLVLSRLVQGLIVMLLVLVPLAGWAYSNAGGLTVSVADWPLPALLPRDQYLAELTVTAHEWAANLLLALVALHVAAAIRHRARTGDPIGTAMLERAGSGPPEERGTG